MSGVGRPIGWDVWIVSQSGKCSCDTIFTEGIWFHVADHGRLARWPIPSGPGLTMAAESLFSPGPKQFDHNQKKATYGPS